MIADEIDRQRLRKAARDFKCKLDQLYRELPPEVRAKHLHSVLKDYLDRAMETLEAEGVVQGTESERLKAREAMLEVVRGEFDIPLEADQI